MKPYAPAKIIPLAVYSGVSEGKCQRGKVNLSSF